MTKLAIFSMVLGLTWPALASIPSDVQIRANFEPPRGFQVATVEIRLPVFIESIEHQIRDQVTSREAQIQKLPTRLVTHGSVKSGDLWTNGEREFTPESTPRYAALQSELDLLKEDLRSLQEFKTSGLWRGFVLNSDASTGYRFDLAQARIATGQSVVANLNILARRFQSGMDEATQAWYAKILNGLEVHLVMSDAIGVRKAVDGYLDIGPKAIQTVTLAHRYNPLIPKVTMNVVRVADLRAREVLSVNP